MSLLDVKLCIFSLKKGMSLSGFHLLFELPLCGSRMLSLKDIQKSSEIYIICIR